jgi:hypothetical protein
MPSTLTVQSERKAPTPAIDSGVIRVARTTREVREVIERWQSFGPQTIAFDIECAASATVPNGSGLHPHLGTIRLGQFAVRDGGNGRAEALVINFWEAEPEPALNLLRDPAWRILIHYTRMEIPWLGYTRGLEITNVRDTHLAGKLNYKRRVEEGDWFSDHPEDVMRAAAGKEPRWALGITSERTLDYPMDKTQQNSAWDAVRLTGEQTWYAGVDVLALLDIEPHVTSHMTAEDWAEHDAKIEEYTRRALRGPGDGDTTPWKGCESQRVLRMIAASTSMAELTRLRRALPQTRIHYSARERVFAAVDAAERQLESGIRPQPPAKIVLPGLSQPF